MAYKYLNVNPRHQDTGDCVIRAVSVLMNQSWSWTYFMICLQGFLMYRMPTSLPDTCPDCYTVKDFCQDFPKGRYLLALDGHVVAVIDGDYYDTGDSGNEVPLFYWRKDG